MIATSPRLAIGAAAALLAFGSTTAEAQITRLVPEHYPHIQAAIDAAVPGDTVDVGPGIYVGWFDYGGKDITVRGRAGAQSTVVDAVNQATVVTIANGETSAAVLEGLTLRGGSAERGGAIRIENASPTIRGCILHRNRAYEGGGIYLRASSALVEGCFLYDNLALFRNGGGGFGGAIYSESGSPTLRHLTVSRNFSSSAASQGLFVATGSALAESSIFHTGAGIQFTTSTSITLNTCLLDGPWSGAGTGNLSADPRFVDPGADPHLPDLHLRHDSPCIDAGLVTSGTAEVDRDVRSDGTPDIGADEYFRSSHWYGGNPVSGGTLRFRGNGAPDDLVLWLIAGNTLPFPIATEFGDLALDPSLIALPMGFAPASGIVEFTATLPWLLPTAFYSQVLVGSSQLRLSASRSVFMGGI
jgi:hypothetical protein